MFQKIFQFLFRKQFQALRELQECCDQQQHLLLEMYGLLVMLRDGYQRIPEKWSYADYCPHVEQKISALKDALRK